MLTLFVAAALSAPAVDPLDAWSGYQRTHQRLTVDMVIDGQTHGTLAIERPRRIRFDLKNPGLDYTLVRDGDEALELSRFERIYCEPLLGPRLTDFESQISD